MFPTKVIKRECRAENEAIGRRTLLNVVHAQDDFGLQLEVLASNRSNVVPLRSVATNERPSWLSQKMVNLPQG